MCRHQINEAMYRKESDNRTTEDKKVFEEIRRNAYMMVFMRPKAIIDDTSSFFILTALHDDYIQHYLKAACDLKM